MTSESKVLKIAENPLVSKMVLEVIKEIDRQDVVSPNLFQSQLRATEVLVGDWVLGWGNNEDAMERFEDLFDVTEEEIELAEDEAYEETESDPEPLQVAIRIAQNWLERAQESKGSCVDEFVVLTYKLSMSAISAPLRRRRMLKGMTKKVIQCGVVMTIFLCLTAGLALCGVYLSACFTGCLMAIFLFKTIDNFKVLNSARREWNA